MADVFISYASKDRERAHALASAFEARGWTVWWDRKIIVGQSYDQVIEQELEIAKSVVVLWSKNAILSEWVKTEAGLAAERGVLVPALLDDVKLPLEFRRRQTADLVNWDGDPTHSGFLSLCAGIAAKSGDIESELPRPPQQEQQQSSMPLPSAPHRSRPWIPGAIALLAVASAVGVYWGLTSATTPSPVSNDAKKSEVQKPEMQKSEVQAAAVEKPEVQASAGLADSVAGTYYGSVVADSQGSSRSDVTVTITKLGPRRVRITSDYERLGTTEVELATSGNLIVSEGGEVSLLLHMDQNPLQLEYNPGGVVYGGERR